MTVVEPQEATGALDPTKEPVFDADQHYYEIRDSFTRHLPKGWEHRTLVEVLENGRIRHVIGGRVNRTLANPIFDPIAKPGVLMDYFRGNPSGRKIFEYLEDREPSPAYYRDPAARVAKLDEQGIDAAWLMPTAGVVYEEPVQDDPEAAAVLFHSFNQWLLDDWTFNYQDRLYVAPYLAMGDPEAAAREVDWMAENGARIVVVRPCGVRTATGWKSPGDPIFDPVWARIQESGMTLIVHVGDSGPPGIERYGVGGHTTAFSEEPNAHLQIFHLSFHIGNYLASLVSDRLFDRFPKLRIASVELGSDYLPLLLKGLGQVHSQLPGYFKQHPVEAFKEHVWVQLFWEDHIDEVLQSMPPERILFGSDWPHAEGLTRPRDFWGDVAHLPVDDQRRIMFSNAALLSGHR